LVNKKTCREGGDESVDEVKGDCGPQEGGDLLISCDNELEISRVSDPKVIPAGQIKIFTSLLKIKKGVKGSYLCKIVLFGKDENDILISGVNKDIIIEVS